MCFARQKSSVTAFTSTNRSEDSVDGSQRSGVKACHFLEGQETGNACQHSTNAIQGERPSHKYLYDSYHERHQRFLAKTDFLDRIWAVLFVDCPLKVSSSLEKGSKTQLAHSFQKKSVSFKMVAILVFTSRGQCATRTILYYRMKHRLSRLLYSRWRYAPRRRNPPKTREEDKKKPHISSWAGLSATTGCVVSE